MTADLRTRLDAIARGGADATAASATTVEPAFFKKHATAFLPWGELATAHDGEALQAPAEILAPLP